jgi:hypothetical protein
MCALLRRNPDGQAHAAHSGIGGKRQADCPEMHGEATISLSESFLALASGAMGVARAFVR